MAKKRNKNKQNNAKISFDQEIITKSDAEKLIISEQHNTIHTETSSRKSKKVKQEPQQLNKQVINNKKPQKKRKHEESQVEKAIDQEVAEDTKAENPNKEKEESKRAKKRKRHQQLIEEKQLKSELALQQKCLNYLSLWKHNKEEWKFEKLKQIWLQQHLFDENRVPEEFWETLIAYFSNAKGQVKQNIINEALKYIESAETTNGENEVIQESVKLKRSRHIIQYLQE